MADPRHPFPISETELERALADLGTRLAYPATPDLTVRVRERLERESPPRRPLPFVRRRRFWLAAAAVLFLLLGMLALFPDTRTAIADRFGLGGVVIRWIEGEPTPPPSPVGATMMLGRAVTLTEARESVDFPIHVPASEGFAEPSEVYVSGQGQNAMVSFVYPARSGLPAGEFTGVGALLTQFPGHTERQFILKGLGIAGGDAETTLEAVTVNGNPGFWIAGAPHGVFLACLDDGPCREERYRLAANVLLWERDGLTFRLESSLPRDEAIAVAASIP